MAHLTMTSCSHVTEVGGGVGGRGCHLLQMQQLSSSATELSLSDETSGVISAIGPPCLLVRDVLGFIRLLFG